MLAPRALWLDWLTQTLRDRQVPLNPPNILSLLEDMLATLEEALEVRLENGSAAGLLLHLVFSCLTRPVAARAVVPEAREHLKHAYPRELALCIHALQVLNLHCAFPLPEDEAYNLLGILKQIDIFIHVGEQTFV